MDEIAFSYTSVFVLFTYETKYNVVSKWATLLVWCIAGLWAKNMIQVHCYKKLSAVYSDRITEGTLHVLVRRNRGSNSSAEQMIDNFDWG